MKSMKAALVSPFYGVNGFVPDEKDACGVAFIANLRGVAKHMILKRLLTAVCCMKHRTGCGADESGDGLGVLTTLPAEMFRQWLIDNESLVVVDPSRIAVAMCFFPREADKEARSIELIREKVLALFGSGTQIRVRDVPISESVVPPTARETMPRIRQIVIVRPSDWQGDYDKALYHVRKQIEADAKAKDVSLYICSMSSTQIVYEGMLYGDQLAGFYAADFDNPLFEIVCGIAHGRYSTNTKPSWPRAQPYRFICHNGEVTSLRGNRAHVKAWRLSSRELSERSCGFILDDDTTDSGQLDNVVEAVLYETGLPLEHVLSMVVPQMYKDTRLSESARAMFLNHAVRMKGWLGPTAIYGMEKGRRVVATLGASNIRPSRFQKLKAESDEVELVLCASDLGAFDVPADLLEDQQPLGMTGGIVVVDTMKGNWEYGRDVYDRLARRFEFDKLNQRLLQVPQIEAQAQTFSNESLLFAGLHGWAHHELWTVLPTMFSTGKPQNRAMGYNVPPAFLSERGQPVECWLKQCFNQITAPPHDSVRDEAIMNLEVFLGPLDSPFVIPNSPLRQKFKLNSPVLRPEEFRWLRDQKERRTAFLEATFSINDGPDALDKRLTQLCEEAAGHVRAGVRILIVSDNRATREKAVVPMLLAVGAINRHLINIGLRFDCGIIANAGVVKDEDHIAKLLTVGANAVHPYLMYEMAEWYVANSINDDLKKLTPATLATKLKAALEKGVKSIIGKVGTPGVWEYQGAGQIEVYGMTRDLVDRVFGPDVPAFFNANGICEIQEVCVKIHQRGLRVLQTGVLMDDGIFASNPAGGEPTSYSNGVLALAHKAAGHDDPKAQANWSAFDQYLAAVKGCGLVTPRRAFRMKALGPSIPIEQVESAENLYRRFFSGDMSLGALTPLVKRDIAIAFNRLGMDSGSGEGGFDSLLRKWSNGDDPVDYFRQIASGRFGVTAQFLRGTKNRQVRGLTFKAAQGAKPGLGGMLPSSKVIPLIARLRRCNPFPTGGLYSPFEHKDTFSIEDYAGVLEWMKLVNPNALRITKCASHIGIEVIASGSAKGGSQAFIVAAGDGGTGASTWEALKASGGYSEIGVKAVHQSLCHNRLRKSCQVWADGGNMHIDDAITLAMLGADRIGFGTLLLVLMTCVKANTCNINCPVDVTTISADGKSRYKGRPEYIVNFFTMFVQRLREKMASLGIRSWDEMLGRCDLLEFSDETPFLAGLKPRLKADCAWLFTPVTAQERYDAGAPTILERNFDPNIDQRILAEAADVISSRTGKVEIGPIEINNRDRLLGAYLAGELIAAHEEPLAPLAEDSVLVRFKSQGAGNGFGCLLPHGFTFRLEGFANDSVGLSLEGGKIIVVPPANVGFQSDYAPLVGDIPCYGATAGKLYLPGGCGNRSGVRNSGATIICHQMGDHGFGFNTLGRVIVLGSIGTNFGSGSSGGIAYVLQPLDYLQRMGLVNTDNVRMDRISSDEELQQLLADLRDFHLCTGSVIAERLLENPDQLEGQFVCIRPIREKVMHPITGQVLFDPSVVENGGVLYQEPDWLKNYWRDPALSPATNGGRFELPVLQ